MANYSLISLEISNPTIDELVKEGIQASKRAQELTYQLLTFSKGGKPITKPQHIEPLLYETATFASRGTHFKVNFYLEPDLKRVNIDYGQISQVINNLMINAIQAMVDGSKFEINIFAENIKLTKGIFNLSPGNYVKISVQDYGIGIEKAKISKIFDPYFTTKATGNGLGLAVSHSIIKKHHGYITVDSMIGKGSTFTFYLPAIEEKKKQYTFVNNQNDEWRQHTRRALILEDEEAVSIPLEKMLKKLNFDVENVNTGEKAIEIFKNDYKDGLPFDLAILDLTIPGGIGGKEILQYLREIDSKCIAIVSSGYANEPTLSDYEKFGFSGVLNKPYDYSQLKNVLSQFFA